MCGAGHKLPLIFELNFFGNVAFCTCYVRIKPQRCKIEVRYGTCLFCAMRAPESVGDVA